MKNKHLFFTLLASLAGLCILAGCTTTTTTSREGFPLIDIVDAEVTLADDSQFAEDEVQWVRSANTKIIGGTLGSKIVAKDLAIRLIETSIQRPIRDGEDLSDWFRNMPRGLKATAHALDRDAKYAADRGATEITVTIDGIPEQTVNQPIRIRVPYDVTNRSWDFVIPPNQDLRFEVYGVVLYSDPPGSAVVVGGAVNREIDARTFRIIFGGARLTEAIPMNTDVSSWFTNIPRGLRVVVPEETLPVTEGQQTVTVTISGTSATQFYEKMNIVVPAAVTTADMALTIPPSDNARYDIGSYSVSSAEDFEIRTGSNWKGAISGWGLTGPEVFKLKDFTPQGIIQVTAESVYAIGDDGEFHWTGDTITYGMLMAEARRLNAHAIIDVVIDSDDVVSKVTERRHIEASHVPSELEQIKINKKIITLETDPNGGTVYVEKVETTRRTWTGTALAIQYAPAYQPTVGDGAVSGYVPSFPADPVAPGERR
jgi:hypothetical protein